MQSNKQTHIIPLCRFRFFILSAVTLHIFFSVVLFAQVDTVWVRRYNGPGNGDDYSRALLYDALGNVYIAGGARGLGMNHDYTTIKYNPNGDTAWMRCYNGPGDGQDNIYALALDNLGNIIVTGGSDDSGTLTDYLTVKYYPNGDTAWMRRYNGPCNNVDNAYALTIDYLGDVLVTGGCMGLGSEDYTTIKYYPNGDTAWVRSYDGPFSRDDEAKAITVDTLGNVYVTGGSWGFDTSAFDYVTIKYYPNGDTAWVRRYNGTGSGDDWAKAIAIDNSGSVYVTGASMGYGTLTDYLTIKYYPNGDTAWVRRYNGLSNDWDKANALALDNIGNVYVTGGSIVSGTAHDYVTIKYYPWGDTAWVRSYNGFINGYDSATALTLDTTGNIYVTGSSCGIYGYDYTTIKYYPNGDTAWVRNYNGLVNASDVASAIAVDHSGNVYVTGWSVGNGMNYDYATIKYTPTGDVDENFTSRISVSRRFIIYPNPAGNYFTIQSPSFIEYSTIKIFDVSGKKIKEIKGINSRTDNIISMSDIKPGVYFIQIDGQTMQKVIKVR